MSQAQDTAERFDRISDVYDETREPLDSDALDKAAEILSKDGCKRILEVGIGTGRIAKPLLDRKFEIVGVDLARKMMAKARSKGIVDLVMGDANHLPIRDKSFEVVLLAHVVHLLEDPVATFEKLWRIPTKEIVIFVRRREQPGESPALAGAEVGDIRQIFRKAAEEMGYALPTRPWDWRERFRNEINLLNIRPPNELITIQDSEVVTTLGERLSFLENRAFGSLSSIPDDVFQKMMGKVKASVDLGKEIRYRRVEQMAIWRVPI
jgi:SAM-dependent methyltransferase